MLLQYVVNPSLKLLTFSAISRSVVTVIDTVTNFLHQVSPVNIIFFATVLKNSEEYRIVSYGLAFKT